MKEMKKLEASRATSILILWGNEDQMSLFTWKACVSLASQVQIIYWGLFIHEMNSDKRKHLFEASILRKKKWNQTQGSRKDLNQVTIMYLIT